LDVCENMAEFLIKGMVRDRMKKAILPGAQTVRPGDAGPVRALLGG